MTLCIAAICSAQEDPIAVVSCDHKVTAGFMSGDFESKWGWIGTRWFFLLAGDLSLARELVIHYTTWLRAKEDEISGDDVLEQLRVPLDSMRRTLIDRYTQKRMGMNLAEFLKIGKASLPDPLFNEITREMTELKFDAELLLVGLVGDKIRLFRVLAEDNKIEECENFGAIGVGSLIAEPILYQRGYHLFWEATRAIYAVYEAQNEGARIAPSVGEDFFLMAIRKVAAEKQQEGERKMQWAFYHNEEQHDFLRQHYEEFRPKAIPGLEFPDNAWEPEN